MVKSRYLVLAVAVVLGVLAYFCFFPSEEKKIKKQLALLSEYGSKPGTESALALARRLNALGSLFTDKVDLKMPAYDISGTHTRQDIINLAARAGMVFCGMKLKFDGVSVGISPDGRARVSATGRLKGKSPGGENVEEAREVEFVLQKDGGGQWLFVAAEVVEVLKK
jgi:ketosteroid isomerase-like protein